MRNSHICPTLPYHFGRSFRFIKCIYDTGFIGKNWYNALDSYLTNKLSFMRSRVDGCSYIYRRENDWQKLLIIMWMIHFNKQAI